MEANPVAAMTRIIVRNFEVREMFIPVLLELVDHHFQHLGIV